MTACVPVQSASEKARRRVSHSWCHAFVPRQVMRPEARGSALPTRTSRKRTSGTGDVPYCLALFGGLENED